MHTYIQTYRTYIHTWLATAPPTAVTPRVPARQRPRRNSEPRARERPGHDVPDPGATPRGAATSGPRALSAGPEPLPAPREPAKGSPLNPRATEHRHCSAHGAPRPCRAAADRSHAPQAHVTARGCHLGDSATPRPSWPRLFDRRDPTSPGEAAAPPEFGAPRQRAPWPRRS